jgi:hypothetical protein
VSDADREKCYDAVRNVMKTMIADYYRQHPELLLDERSQNAIRISLNGLQCIFDELDKWEITQRSEQA